jgi:hypothetical protein
LQDFGAGAHSLRTGRADHLRQANGKAFG